MRMRNVLSYSMSFALAAMVVVSCRHTPGETRTVGGVSVIEDKPGLWSRARLAPDSAIRIALSRVPGGRVTKAELEEEGGRLIYSFDLEVVGKKGEHEVHVDAMTGAIVKEEHES